MARTVGTLGQERRQDLAKEARAQQMRCENVPLDHISDASVGALRLPCKTSSTICWRASASRFRLSHCRNPPKLLHQAQGIEVGPLFGDLATHEAKEIAAGKRHVLTSWGKTLKG